MNRSPLKAQQCFVPGDLVSTNLEAYKAGISQVLNQPEGTQGAWTVFELDLRQARFLDSVGINLIVLTLRKLQAQSKTLRILVATKNLHRVLTFTRLTYYAEVVLEQVEP